MRKPNIAEAGHQAADLRQRAARARDAAGRFIRRATVARESAAGAAADQADADLLQVGQQLDDAIARVGPLHDEWSRLGEATLAALPARPACLYFRASDHALYLRLYCARPGELDGMEVTAEDVAWMRRKPYAREVPRPVRPEDGLPADAHTVVESHPWPEAQARADEIITAWDAWKAECARIRASMEAAEFEAEEPAEVVEAEILALADRVAEMPAATAEGLRIKLRASAHYVEEHDADYPAGRLLNSLLRDARSGTPAAGITPHPDAALFALGAEFMAAWVAEEADGDEPEYRICTRIAQQIIRTPAVTVAGYGIKALLLARLDSDSSGPHKPIEVHGPPDSWWNALRQVQQGAARLAGLRDAGNPGSSTVIDGRLPCPAHDLSALSIVELARLYPVIVRTDEVLGSSESAPCFWSEDRTTRTRPGQIVNREADRLSQFASAIAGEMGRRQPADDDEAEERANTLLSHMVLTGGVAEHPELIAEINATWGA